MINQLWTETIYLNPFKLKTLDNSSAEARYRLVSLSCDIEISQGVKDLIEFIGKHQGRTVQKIAEQYQQEKGYHIELTGVINNLWEKGIFCNHEAQISQKSFESLSLYRNQTKTLWLKKRLIDTDRFSGFFKLFSFTFTKQFLIPATLLCLIMNIFFLWQIFFFPFTKKVAYSSNFDYIYIIFILFLMTLIHEFGHIIACKKFDVPTPGGIGIGIYYYMLVGYSDVHESWDLSRTQRMLVSAGGFYWQILFAIPLYLIFFYSRSAMFRDYLIIFNLSFFGVLNPFLKMDGYWFLSDALGVPNLHSRLKAYFSKCLWPRMKGKAPATSPFKSYPLKVQRMLFIYILGFLLFMIIFIFAFAVSFSNIAIHFNKEIILPVNVLKQWSLNGENQCINAVNVLVRNNLILVGGLVIVIQLLARLIKSIIKVCRKKAGLDS